MASLTPAPPPALTCSVLGESRGRDVAFRGRVVSRADLKGGFRLVIEKDGPSGHSRIAQNGAFVAAAGIPVLVGSTMLSVEPGGHVAARLEVTAGGASFTCEPYLEDRT